MADELEKRVAALEGEVRTLRAEVTDLTGQQRNDAPESREAEAPTGSASATSPPEPARPAPTPSPPEGVAPPQDQRQRPRAATNSKAATDVIAKVGIALVLLGVAYLLKYSYDQGWLTETVRVTLGLLTGAVLLGTGLTQRRDNAMLAAVLQGGAIATFYGSFFASYTLYALVPWSVALATMLGTTMLGFVLAVKQDQPSLSVVATIGALATPFLIDAPDSDVLILALYTTLVLLGTTAIYLLRGWRALLLTSTLGGFVVVATAAGGLPDIPESTELVFVLVAIATSVLAPSLAPAFRATPAEASRALEDALAIGSPMLGIVLIDLAIHDGTAVTVVAVAVIAIAFVAAHRFAPKNHRVLVVAASALLGAAIGIGAGVEEMAMALAGLAVGANVVASRGFGALRLLGYPALAFLGAWSAFLLLDGVEGLPFLNADGLHMLIATGVLIGVGFSHPAGGVRWLHVYVATLASMSIVVHQLGETPGGEVLSTGIWGFLGLGAVVFGVVRDESPSLALGVIVMLLTAAKLLVFDLDSIATIWRVALFMTFGVSMLIISYLVPRLTPKQEAAPGEEAREP